MTSTNHGASRNFEEVVPTTLSFSDIMPQTWSNFKNVAANTFETFSIKWLKVFSKYLPQRLNLIFHQ